MAVMPGQEHDLPFLDGNLRRLPILDDVEDDIAA
jgi:hypothetical protein